MFRSSKTKKQANKRVSFNDDLVVAEFQGNTLEELEASWYSEKDMFLMQLEDSKEKGEKVTKKGEKASTKGSKGENLAAFLNQMDEPSEEELSHDAAQKLVKKIATKCRVQLDQADGYWDPKMGKELAKMSLAGSKDAGKAALKRAKAVYQEVYQDQAKRRSIIGKLMSSRRSTSLAKPTKKLESLDSERTFPMEESMMSLDISDHGPDDDRPKLMRSTEHLPRMPRNIHGAC